MATARTRGRRLTSISGFMSRIFNRTDRDTNSFFAFRGHESEDYKLRPSLFRKDSFRQNEKIMLQELIASSPSEFSNDTSTFDRLVRMQHYNLPTRLLDCTLNPLVALYFATNSTTDETLSKTGEVIVFKVPQASIKFFDSDAVSCISNFSYLTQDEKDAIPVGTVDKIIFNDNPHVDRVVQFIRDEKPGFRNIIEPDAFDKVYFVTPRIPTNELSHRPESSSFSAESTILTMALDLLQLTESR